MRLIGWGADHSVHPDPRQVRLGIVVLTALGASALLHRVELLHRVDESSVSAVLSMVSKDRCDVVADPRGDT